jgi:methylglyoxal synthase
MDKPTIALIAHDAKKADMVYLVQAHRDEFSQLNLVATGTTGKFIQSRIGLPVRLMKSGPQGGDQQIGALVASGEVQAVIFLRDPLTAHPHEPDVSALVSWQPPRRWWTSCSITPRLPKRNTRPIMQKPNRWAR